MEVAFSGYGAVNFGSGTALKLCARVMEGPHKDTHFPYSLVLEGPGSESGQQDFAALRRATGVLDPADTSELLRKRFRARIDVVMVDGELCNTIEAVGPGGAVPDWTPEQRFMFDLEGELYKMMALATTLEALLAPITNGMSKYDRPMGAALDHAVVNLADAVREIEERYMAVRFPEKQADAA